MTASTTPSAGGGTPVSPQQAQVAQIRQTLLDQIAALKVQIQGIQQQSLQALQSQVETIFQNQLNQADATIQAGLQQLINQAQTPPVPPPTPPTTPGTPAPASPAIPAYSVPQTPVQSSVDAAAEIAGNAMSTAEQNVQKAQQSVAGLGTPSNYQQ